MWSKVQHALVISRREMRDQLRDWRIIAPIVILTLIFPGIMNFTASQAVNFVERYGAEIIGERLIPFLLMVVGFFPISISLVIALESFVGEKERGSIEPLLSSPLEDWQLYLGKLVAVMVPPLAASYMGIAVFLFGVYRKVGWTPDPELLIQILVLTFVQAFVMVSGAVVISTQTTSVRAANLLASFIIIPMSFLIQGESMVMFWGIYNALWWAVLGLLVIAALLLRTGVTHFNREELLGRELDTINLKWIGRTFVETFKGQAASVKTWYTVELRSVLGRLRLPFVLLFFVLLASLWVGGTQAERFAIPAELIQFEDLDRSSFVGIERLELFSVAGIRSIWLQNIRVLLAATLIGMFTYGVLGIMVVMLPFMIIGYFVAVVATAGYSPWLFFAAFVLPHGIFEIPAILLAGAAFFRMGAGMAAPQGGKSISEGLLHALADWAKIMVGVVIPLLLLAAVAEAFLTPQIALWIYSR